MHYYNDAHTSIKMSRGMFRMPSGGGRKADTMSFDGVLCSESIKSSGEAALP